MVTIERLIVSLVGFALHLLYTRFAWAYDLVAALVSRGRWWDWVLSAVDYLPGPMVLETGPGTGHLQRALSKRGLRSVALEPSWQMILRFNRVKDSIELVNGYAQFIPFKSATFNQVVATFPTNYIIDPRSLAEIHRILAPGGLLVIIPVAWITGPTPLDRFLAAIFRVTRQSVPDTTQLEHHFTAPLQAAGFNPEVIRRQLPGSLVLIILARRNDYSS